MRCGTRRGVVVGPLLLAVLLAAGTALAAGEGSQPSVDMSAIPLPELSTFEEGVRSQLKSLRASLERLAASDDATESELGEALGRLGSLYLLYNFIQPAEACLVQAKRMEPRDFRWTYYLAALYSLEGRDPEAEAELHDALTLRPDDLPTLIRLGNIQLDGKDLDAAEETFSRALAVDPESTAARFGMARVFYDRGDYDSAVPRFESVLEQLGESGEDEGSVAHFFLGMALRQRGDLDGARKQLALNRHQEVLFPDPLIDRLQSMNVSREAYFTAGTEALRRGDAEAALEFFRKTLEVSPDDPEGHYNVGMALLQMGDAAQAEEHIRRATELRPDYRNAQFNLGVLLSRRGEYAEAAEHFARAAEIDPDDLRSQVAWAEALARLDRPGEAIAKLLRVLEIDPAMVKARLSLASIQVDQDQPEAARENLDRILALAPGAVEERSEAHFLLAGLSDSPDEKIEHLEAAVELAPDFLDAHRALASLLGQKGDYSGAAEHLGRAVELAPQDERTRFGYAMALMLGGSYAEAREALESGVEALPDSIPLRHALARLLATCPDPSVRDGQRAVALAEAVAQQELTVDHAETLAMAYAEVGRFAEAVRWQERVIAEAEKLGEPTSTLRQRLELYRRNQPVRAPWAGG